MLRGMRPEDVDETRRKSIEFGVDTLVRSINERLVKTAPADRYAFSVDWLQRVLDIECHSRNLSVFEVLDELKARYSESWVAHVTPPILFWGEKLVLEPK